MKKCKRLQVFLLTIAYSMFLGINLYLQLSVNLYNTLELVGKFIEIGRYVSLQYRYIWIGME